VVLVGQLLDHILRPLAKHLGVAFFVSNRLEFRDGHATGRLLDPVVPPRSPWAWLASGPPDGRIPREKLLRQLGWIGQPEECTNALQSSARPPARASQAVRAFGGSPQPRSLSIREILKNRNILLIGVTGFIGKVWLVELLESLPDIGKITL